MLFIHRNICVVYTSRYRCGLQSNRIWLLSMNYYKFNKKSNLWQDIFSVKIFIFQISHPKCWRAFIGRQSAFDFVDKLCDCFTQRWNLNGNRNILNFLRKITFNDNRSIVFDESKNQLFYLRMTAQCVQKSCWVLKTFQQHKNSFSIASHKQFNSCHTVLKKEFNVCVSVLKEKQYFENIWTRNLVQVHYLQEYTENTWDIDQFGDFQQLVDNCASIFPDIQLTTVCFLVQFPVNCLDQCRVNGAIK